MCLSTALLPLEQWSANHSSSFGDLSFSVCSTTLSESPKCLVCSPSTLHNHPPAGLVSRIWIIVSQCGDYEFQVLLRTKDKGTVTCKDELHHLCGMLSKSSGYKFCPGLDKAVYNNKYASVLRYDPKSVRLMSEPFSRVDSPRCQLWHKLAKNSSIFERDMEEVLCQPCKKMISHLDCVRAAASVTPAEKVVGLDPSSRCPLAILSPNSRKKRKENLLKEQYQYKKYEHIDLTLNDEQSDEMASIIEITNRNASDTLNKVIEEVGSQGQAAREIWKNDLRSEFDKDQAVNGKFMSVCVCLCVCACVCVSHHSHSGSSSLFSFFP